ncbi:MAG TPA: site-specific DNA-methyltransferase [Elusimicrobia bacterium]|nr:site-specific DNA-methyltransferase [Elusimicrobiota bacterium]
MSSYTKTAVCQSRNGGNGHRHNGGKEKFEPVLRTPSGKLYQADCIPFMKAMAAESVDLVFADPPFNLGKNYGASVKDDLADTTYLAWSHQWLQETTRILKPGGSLFVYNLPKWNLVLGAWLSQYLRFRNWIAVDIKFSLPISGRLYPSHYSLLYFTKGEKTARFSPPRLPIETCRHCGGELRDYGGYKDRMNPSGVNLTDVWRDLSPVRHARFKRRKANELPLKMLDRVLDISTKEGDLVFDPFGGSGTTFVAAELKQRRWIGSEIGDCRPIIQRFKSLDVEREIWCAQREKVNRLFTKEAMTLRNRNGFDTSKYRSHPEEHRLLRGDLVRT